MWHVLLSLPCVVLCCVAVDPAEQIWQLTKSLQRAQAENSQLQSDNEYLTNEVKSLSDRVSELEKLLSQKNKEVRN